jgi:DNA-binding response OmpR family regulator
MRRRILLVDDEVAVLLTLKAVLEISGFDVDTAASAREGVSKLHTREYHMLITDMRMESDAAGVEVIRTARAAAYHPAVALLTAFPVAEEDWQEMGADKLLVKPMHTRILLEQIENLIVSHELKLATLSGGKAGAATPPRKKAAKQVPAKQIATRKTPVKKAPAKKAAKPAPKKTAVVKKISAKPAAAKKAVKKAAKKTAKRR